MVLQGSTTIYCLEDEMVKHFLSYVLLCALTITSGSVSSSKVLRIATVTDVHIGENCGGELTVDACRPLSALQEALLKMNEMKLDGVFLTGDLTSSALMEEYQALRDLLDDTLVIPWWPMLGNHDVWPYTKQSADDPLSFNQTDTPVGDQYLADVFGDILSQEGITSDTLASLYDGTNTTDWPTSACLNANYNYNSYFHNFMVTFPEFSNKLKFLALDWNSRAAALPEPGVGPEAELHDFNCGTLYWLDNNLKALTQDHENIQMFLLQHHPFHNRESLDPFGNNYLYNFTFDKQQDKRIQQVFETYIQPSDIIAVHSGHMHRWFNGSAFTPQTCLNDELQLLPQIR